MKKIILLIALTICGLSSAQIKKIETEKVNKTEIGKISPMGVTYISLSKYNDDYIFSYKDTKFAQISEYKSFSFKETGSDLDNLYKMIIDGIDTKPEDDIMIELPDDIIWLHFEKALGTTSVQIRHAVNKNPEIIGMTTWMTKAKVNKLFNKK